MKKLLALILACSMILSLAACGGSETAPTETAPTAATEVSATEAPAADAEPQEGYSAEKYFTMAEDDIVTWTPVNERTGRIGLIVPDSTTEFYNGIVTTVKQIVEDAGYELVSDGVNGDFTRGVTAIETWLAGGIDAIIIMAQDQSCDLALKKAMEQGVLVVSASAKVEYYHHWLKQDDYAMGLEVAAMAAKWMKEKGYENGQYICVNNPMTPATVDKSQGTIDGMKEYLPDGECVGVVTMSGSIDQVRADFDTLLLQYPDTRAIVTMHNAFALIGMEAAKAAGKAVVDEFAVFGASLSEQVLSELHKDDSVYYGEIWMGDQGRTMAEHTLGLLNGESYTHDWSALNFPITRDNLDTYYDDYYAQLGQ